MFVNAVVNQPRSLDRVASIEAGAASAEVKRAVAELCEAQTGAERSWLKTVLDRLPAGVIIAEAPSEAAPRQSPGGSRPGAAAQARVPVSRLR